MITLLKVLLLLIMALIWLYLYRYVSKRKDDEINGAGQNARADSVYNLSPVSWIKSTYSVDLLENQIVDISLKNIFIVEPVQIMRAIYRQLFDSQYNLYFFVNNDELLNTLKPQSYLNQKNYAVPHLIIGSFDADGILLFNKLTRLMNVDRIPFILSAGNTLYLQEQVDAVIIKPFDYAYINTLVKKLIL